MVNANDFAGLLDAIQAEPYDPTLRRIFADMLDDRPGGDCGEARVERAKADMMDGAWKPGKKALAWLKRVKAALNYRGRKVKWKCAGSVFVHDTRWGGGTCNYYAEFDLCGQLVGQYADPVEHTTDVPRDAVIVEQSYFCGKDCGLTVYVSVEAAYHLIDGESEE